MPKCGSQIILCDLPVRFDTYSGCSHGCRYCFVTRKRDIQEIKLDESPLILRNFIEGKRSSETRWCDWDIPLHWGGMSDPFQPIENELGISFECLKIFAETNYPFVVSTKGTTCLARPEYLALLKQCNAVVQVSLISPKFDVLEPGAPSFEERLQNIAVIASHCKRLIIRIQPYVREVKGDIINNLPRYKNAGVYGITIEGIKYFQKRKGMIKSGADFVYPVDKLKADFIQIRQVAHDLGIKFFCGENRLRNMGDSLCCCGVEGLSGFNPNMANLNHFLYDRDNFKYTDHMQKISSTCFRTLAQDTVSGNVIREKSFAEIMDIFTRDKTAVDSLSEK
jgi:DNA repair photolyase